MGYALLFALHRPHSRIVNFGTLGIISLFTIGAVRSSYVTLPNTGKMYEQNLDHFSELEKSALSIYSLPDSLPQDQLSQHIEKDGIHNWEAALTLLKNTDSLDLPDYIHTHLQRLERYTDLRLNSTRFYYKAQSENTSAYDDSLSFYRLKVKAILDTINGRAKSKE